MNNKNDNESVFVAQRDQAVELHRAWVALTDKLRIKLEQENRATIAKTIHHKNSELNYNNIMSYLGRILAGQKTIKGERKYFDALVTYLQCPEIGGEIERLSLILPSYCLGVAAVCVHEQTIALYFQLRYLALLYNFDKKPGKVASLFADITDVNLVRGVVFGDTSKCAKLDSELRNKISSRINKLRNEFRTATHGKNEMNQNPNNLSPEQKLPDNQMADVLNDEKVRDVEPAEVSAFSERFNGIRNLGVALSAYQKDIEFLLANEKAVLKTKAHYEKLHSEFVKRVNQSDVTVYRIAVKIGMYYSALKEFHKGNLVITGRDGLEKIALFCEMTEIVDPIMQEIKKVNKFYIPLVFQPVEVLNLVISIRIAHLKLAGDLNIEDFCSLLPYSGVLQRAVRLGEKEGLDEFAKNNELVKNIVDFCLSEKLIDSLKHYQEQGKQKVKRIENLFSEFAELGYKTQTEIAKVCRVGRQVMGRAVRGCYNLQKLDEIIVLLNSVLTKLKSPPDESVETISQEVPQTATEQTDEQTDAQVENISTAEPVKNDPVVAEQEEPSEVQSDDQVSVDRSVTDLLLDFVGQFETKEEIISFLKGENINKEIVVYLPQSLTSRQLMQAIGGGVRSDGLTFALSRGDVKKLRISMASGLVGPLGDLLDAIRPLINIVSQSDDQAFLKGFEKSLSSRIQEHYRVLDRLEDAYADDNRSIIGQHRREVNDALGISQHKTKKRRK